MMIFKKFALTACFLLSVALATGSPRLASARGFCNIDGLGPKELQQQARTAAAVFFEGGSHLMTMLSAFERNDGSKGRGAGSEAAKAFGTASELFRSIKMPEIVDQKLSTLNVETAAAIAQTPPSVLFLDIAKTAQGPNASADLIKRCSSELEQMRSATAQYLDGNQDRERTTAALLSTWARVLFTGRTISALFAAAGGEN